ncbi:hypothetical protein H0H81_000368 [Sphagnurus paluster]|uniref:Dihydroorotate oxidase n=1 Tax=Sphagnurus paluster TaxID=117069 RepID=A0A9P7FRG5_9AGAR|nr:hypothetical protein H0H81_000368 [Sphagnurus paluster]
MVKINTLNISPPLINSSCAWASDLAQLTALYESPFTGAVTTRTATLDGFQEGPSHTVAFTTAESLASINSYGYSPHPLTQYLTWIKALLTQPGPTKPFIISITSSSAPTLRTMVAAIQTLRTELGASLAPAIAIELNTSCPNIPGAPPTAYAISALRPLLAVLCEAHTHDPSLTLGLKLPPFVHRAQFVALLDGLVDLCPPDSDACPFAFFTCTNTLGNSLLFADQCTPPDRDNATTLEHEPKSEPNFAVPTALGGLAGEPLHALALGNVYTFAQLLQAPEYARLRGVALVGVGGVTSRAAAERMRRAGACVVGCATFFGREGVRAFEILSQG